MKYHLNWLQKLSGSWLKMSRFENFRALKIVLNGQEFGARLAKYAEYRSGPITFDLPKQFSLSCKTTAPVCYKQNNNYR